MKLLFCPDCRDILSLHTVPRACKCGQSGGHYRQGEHSVEVRGKAVVLGVNNNKLKRLAQEAKGAAGTDTSIDLCTLAVGTRNVIADPADVDEVASEHWGSIPGQEWIVALGAPYPMPGKWLYVEVGI